MKTTIKFPKSDSFAFFVTINKIAKALDNAFFTVKENPDEEPVLQKKLGAGISLADSRLYKNQLSYKVQIDGADTQFMEVGVRYFFDVKGTIGNAQKTFLWGELILSETETGYLNPAIQGDTVAVAQVYTATFETGAQSEYVETEVDPVAMAKIGDMTKLNTTAKDTLVKAINEVNAPTFTESAPLENVVSGEKQSTLWGKVKKWFSSLKALAFKDKVGTEDITDGAVTTEKFSSSATCPHATEADISTRADYASADTSKGTIEERLTNLGFKGLPSDRMSLLYVSGAGSLSGQIRLLKRGTNREGNRTNVLFELTLSGSGSAGPIFEFFGKGKEALSSVFIPFEYRPASTSTYGFNVRLAYTYANGISVTTYVYTGCTIYGADTENAGKISLQALPARISGVSTALSSVTVDLLTPSVHLDTGYSSKSL